MAEGNQSQASNYGKGVTRLFWYIGQWKHALTHNLARLVHIIVGPFPLGYVMTWHVHEHVHVSDLFFLLS